MELKDFIIKVNFKALYINNSNEYDHKILNKMLCSNDFRVEFDRCLLKAYDD